MTKHLYIGLLFVSSFNIFGADQSYLDSLWSVWSDESQSDSNRLQAMYDFSWDGYLMSQPDSSIYFANLMLDFAKKKQNLKYQGFAYNVKGVASYIKGEYDKSVEFQEQFLAIKLEERDTLGMSSAYSNIGNVYYRTGDYKNASKNYEYALKLATIVGEKEHQANYLNNLGVVYKQQGNYATAIEYYTRGLNIREEMGQEDKLGPILSNIGSIHNAQGDYRKSLTYYFRSLECRQKLGDRIGAALTHTNIGAAYFNLNKLDSADYHHRLSLAEYSELGDLGGEAAGHIHLGDIFRKQEQYDSALIRLNIGLKLYEEVGDKLGITNTLNKISKSYKGLGRIKQSILYSRQALDLAEEIGSPMETQEAAEDLYWAYKETSDYRSALEMHEIFIEMRDSLESEANQKEVIKQEYKYEYEKQAAADSTKNAERQKVNDAQLAAQDAQLKAEAIQRYALYGGLALLVLLGGFILNRLRVTRRQRDTINEQKKEVEKQKEVIQVAHRETEIQKEIIEETHKEITDSINYAKRLQDAILPAFEEVNKYLKENFILFKPKDVVSGDFYWFEQVGEVSYLASADCTGHGVPGAMVSVVCSNALHRTVNEFGITSPAKILDKTRELVIETFAKSGEDVKDGMDIALCAFNGTDVIFGGANNPLWIVRKTDLLTDEQKEAKSSLVLEEYSLIEYKADKQPVGLYAGMKDFSEIEFSTYPGDLLYFFTDGFADQFGGEKGKKFKYKPFKKLLIEISQEPISAQSKIIEDKLDQWKGDYEQVDDICVIGVRLAQKQ